MSHGSGRVWCGRNKLSQHKYIQMYDNDISEIKNECFHVFLEQYMVRKTKTISRYTLRNVLVISNSTRLIIRVNVNHVVPMQNNPDNKSTPIFGLLNSSVIGWHLHISVKMSHFTVTRYICVCRDNIMGPVHTRHTHMFIHLRTGILTIGNLPC